nr:class I SAM-dependent methyltransferase [bacterium]
MFSVNQYQLLDFGDGRRLERFGPLVLDRPCPAAEEVTPAEPALWQAADGRFARTDGKQGEWMSAGPLPERWTISHGPLTLELKRTEFGHLGVFAEQAANWDWLTEQISAAHPPGRTPDAGGSPLKVLNLFAYTGASTLAAAAAGAQVTHVDAARNVLAWARRNADLSAMSAAPIRWIAEDAQKFVGRELKRENRYDAVILDPPSYG